MGQQITNRRLLGHQILIVVLLITGYAGFYACRSNFSVTLPLIIDDLVARGIPAAEARIRLGQIVSLGVLAYALGKIFLGGLADFWGGKRQFLAAMGGAVLFTLIAAASGGLPVFAAAWVGNRLAQSAAWAGMVKITSRWFSFATYGTAMGAISLSYLFGDAIARHLMGVLIAHGLGWRGVFVVAAFSLFALFLANLCCSRNRAPKSGNQNPSRTPTIFLPAEVRRSGRAVLLRCSDHCSAAPPFGLSALYPWAARSFGRPSIPGRQPTFMKWSASARPNPPSSAPSSRCSEDSQYCSLAI